VPMPEIEPRSRAGELAQGVSTVIELWIWLHCLDLVAPKFPHQSWVETTRLERRLTGSWILPAFYCLSCWCLVEDWVVETPLNPYVYVGYLCGKWRIVIWKYIEAFALVSRAIPEFYWQ
jgi:hypothetical protein